MEEEERREEREVVEVEDEEEDLHSLPAGVWPKQVNECLCQFTLRLRVTLKLFTTFSMNETKIERENIHMYGSRQISKYVWSILEKLGISELVFSS